MVRETTTYACEKCGATFPYYTEACAHQNECRPVTMNPTPKAVEALIAAARKNVERGHFTELYEGFNNCPAAYAPAGRNCTCGFVEAREALRLCGVEVEEGQWPDT